MIPRYLLFLVCAITNAVTRAWSPAALPTRSSARQEQRLLLPLLHARSSGSDDKEQRQQQQKGTSSSATATTTQQEWQDEDAGAGVVGAQFFGGNKQKEEFFDPIAEEGASELAFEATTATSFDRFADRTAFDTLAAAQLAKNYQDFINRAIQGEVVDSPSADTILSNTVTWESPFPSKASSPLQALQEASSFYRRLDVAITSAKTLSENHYQLRWEIGVAWPTFWEPSVLLTGTSTVHVVENGGSSTIIQKQVDTLDNADFLGNLARQIVPRFWDVYHIGMTPTAEISPAWERRGGGLIQNFVLYDVPPRWVWAPTLLDKGNREDANASFLPNHSFTTAIRTMGPKKDDYVPTTPTQIDISPSPNKGNRILWKIPVTVQLQSRPEWPLFQTDDSDNDENAHEEASGSYVWQPARRVATLPTGLARPQEEGVTELRKRLYERVTAAGLKPKLDANGRPCFFFWSASTKTCFTKQGLGMSVYEWRPAFAQSNHVGLELEETPELTSS